MEPLSRWSFGVILVVLIGCDPITTSPKLPRPLQEEGAVSVDRSILDGEKRGRESFPEKTPDPFAFDPFSFYTSHAGRVFE